jgi:hypothetical protein
MAIITVDHSDKGKCLLDTELSKYYILPEARNQFEINGKLFPFYDEFAVFIESDDYHAIIPVFCGGFKRIKKRTQAELISRIGSRLFFNVERINNKWVKNDIENCIPNNAYFAYVVKDDGALNDILVSRIMKINKNDYGQGG